MSQFRFKQESANPIKRIKSEAGRRIVAVVGPTWKQTNLLATVQELHLRETRGIITPEETAELNKILNLWGWIKRVRDESDVLEKINPPDYKENKHWPPPPPKAELPEKAQKI